MKSRRLATLAAAAALLLIGGCDSTSAPTPRPAAATAPAWTPTWTKAAASPLSPRYDADIAWVGGRLLVVGGRTAPCMRQDPYCHVERSARRDGAVYDPASDTWHQIAVAPGPVQGDEGLVVGDLFVIPTKHGPAVYDVTSDQWRSIQSAFPGFNPRRQARMASDGKHLLASFDGGSFGFSESVQSCSVRTHRCRLLRPPATVKAASLVATRVGPAWVGSVGHELFANGPDLVAVRRAGRWHRLPVPGSTARRPILPRTSVGDRLVALGEHGGAPVGLLDPDTGVWTRLHRPARSRDLEALRAVGDGWVASGGWLLSPDAQWTRLGHPPGAHVRWYAAGAVAQGRLYVFGGSDFPRGRPSRPSNELWIRDLPTS